MSFESSEVSNIKKRYETAPDEKFIWRGFMTKYGWNFIVCRIIFRS